jgi:hypothetical protein
VQLLRDGKAEAKGRRVGEKAAERKTVFWDLVPSACALGYVVARLRRSRRGGRKVERLAATFDQSAGKVPAVRKTKSVATAKEKSKASPLKR